MRGESAVCGDVFIGGAFVPIPAEAVEALGLRPGDTVRYAIQGRMLVLVPWTGAIFPDATMGEIALKATTWHEVFDCLVFDDVGRIVAELESEMSQVRPGSATPVAAVLSEAEGHLVYLALESLDRLAEWRELNPEAGPFPADHRYP